MVETSESETIGGTATNNSDDKTKNSVWSDVPRRLVTICVGIPFVWKLLERPITAYIFFSGAHAISAWEYSLLEPSIATTKQADVVVQEERKQKRPSSEQLSKQARLLFCVTSLALASIPYSYVSLFSFATSLAAGIFAIANRHHWVVGLLVVTLPFRSWCDLACRFEDDTTKRDHSSFASTIAVLLTVWNADTGALIAGRLFGRKKATKRRQSSERNSLPSWIRRISPAKTMEGFVGGMAGGVGSAVWAVPQLLNRFSIETSPGFRKLWGLNENNHSGDGGSLNRLILGFCLSVLAILGDLVESSIKRRSQSKDSGRVLPGHGGILDRFDSSLLAVLFYRVVLDNATKSVPEDVFNYVKESRIQQAKFEL